MTRYSVLLTLPLLLVLSANINASAQPANPHESSAFPVGSVTYEPRILSAAEAKADIALMRRALETIHPGLYRYAGQSSIDAAFARLEAATMAPISELALYREIALMMSKIRCDHTKPELSDRLTAFREQNATHLPIRFRIIEGRMIVLATDGQADGPPIGSEILRINDMPVSQLFRQLSSAVAYDGTTDQAIAVKFGDDSDVMGDDFNEYYPAFHGFARRWTVDWIANGDATEHRSSLAPLTFTRWTAMASPDGAYRSEFYKSITWRMAGPVARLSIDTFVNYRNPVDPAAFLGGFFRSMREAGTKRLILDLRGNGGGSDDAQVALVRYLVGTPIIFSKPIRYKTIRYGDLPNFISSWGDTRSLFNPPESDFVRAGDGWYDRIPVASNDASSEYDPTLPQAPFADRFEGDIIILAGPANGSGATRTMAVLKEMAGATIVGEDSSGSAEGPTAGRILLVTLPNSGLKLRIPNAWNRTNIKYWTPGKGVAADVLVVPTLSDFQSGRDRALTVARTARTDAGNVATALALFGEAIKSEWSGFVEMREADQRTILPTSLDAKDQTLTFRSGKNGVILKSVTVSFDFHARSLILTDQPVPARGPGTASQKLTIVEFRADPDGNVTLVADGRQSADEEATFTRIILTLDKNRLRLTRMDRTEGTPFLITRSYEMTK